MAMECYNYTASMEFQYSKKKNKAPGPVNDRFIPNRSNINFEIASMLLQGESDRGKRCGPEYRRLLEDTILVDVPALERVVTYKARPPVSLKTDMLKPSSINFTRSHKFVRNIPQDPQRVLDAPDVLDDYYLNLLDWSSNDVISVALGDTVYLWTDRAGSTMLMEASEQEGPVTSVSWSPKGKYLGIGLNNGEVQLWDVGSSRMVRSMKAHSSRVGSLAWNGSILSSGDRAGIIYNHDLRIKEHVTTKMAAHTQEVCGLTWSPSGQQLASGGNDNLVYIWDATAATSRGNTSFSHRLDGHQAAVKALAWCPFQNNLLATGGGTADRCIKFWNTKTGTCQRSIDTNSQVCSLVWSKHDKELLSSHGYSQNQLTVWNYPSMTRMAELKGHNSRVLHLAQSPDGCTVASLAGDETLRLWSVFGSQVEAAVNKPSRDSVFNGFRSNIR